MAEPLVITYVGGGSRFVVTLLHGLAAEADALRTRGRPLRLRLVDVDPARAEPMARYASIVAREAGLDLAAEVTADLHAALDAADWVMESIGIWDEVRAAFDRYRGRIDFAHSEAAPHLAVEAALYWPHVARLAGEMRARCPEALFTTLVNPTDCVAAAVADRFGLRAVGVCVEVPQTIGWLARWLRVPYEAIGLEYLGLNHLGWVSRFTVAGEPGEPILAAALPQMRASERWGPLNDQWVHTFEATGLLRTSPYHPWPYLLDWTEERVAQRDRQRAASGRQPHAENLSAALEAGRMIPEDDPLTVPQPCWPYQYPETRFTLGAIAVGLAGGDAGPVPVQSRNGAANPSMPEAAYLEVPTRVEAGAVRPQPVTPPPGWCLAQLRVLAEQRRLLAEWLATGEPRRLTEALMIWPNVASTDALLDLIRDLPEMARRTV